MSVTVRLHAGVRERAGRESVTVTATSVPQVLAALKSMIPSLSGALSACRFAVDDEFVGPDAPVREGATVDVIPPVSGG